MKAEVDKKGMNRKQITKLLTETLIATRLSKMGVHYATEVTFDMGTTHPKRVDVVSFHPEGGIYSSDIEKGKFICYEIKSCKEDLYSGNGLNFFGEQNYLVMTMETYKEVVNDFNDGTFQDYLCKNFPQSSKYFGVIVMIPLNRTEVEEFENTTSLDINDRWQMEVVLPCRNSSRKRSMIEMLFCMLRSGR